MKLRNFVACHSEPQAKNPGICCATNAVIPSGAAKRRSRGTPALGLASLCLMAGSSFSSATAQTNVTQASANIAQPSKPFTFEVVSIRPRKSGTNGFDTHYLPDGFQMTTTLQAFISLAYTPGGGAYGSFSKVIGAPAWAATDFYDIEARVAHDDLATWQQTHDILHSEPLRQGLQAALQDRAKLVLHITQLEQPCLNLVIGKQPLKLHPTGSTAIQPVPGKTNKLGEAFYIEDNGKRQFVGVSMDEFAGLLLTRLNNWHLVQNKTGLAGRYDFTLPVEGSSGEDDSSTTPLDRMPVKSVGLALKPSTAPLFNIYIDHIEKPDAN
jgi:uncharacterized protein (TIGR03435 family)